MFEQNPLAQSVGNWFKDNFSNPEAVGLTFTFIAIFLILEFFGKLLMPILVSVVIAYVLNAAVHRLVRYKFPRILAFFIVYFIFLGILIWALFGLLPLLWRQASNLLQEIPNAFGQSQMWLQNLIKEYPTVAGYDPVSHTSDFIKAQSTKIGQVLVNISLATIPNLISAALYVILVPLLVFFFLKDGKMISDWFIRFLPKNRGLLASVWSEVNEKIGAYIKGRIIEMFIVGFVSAIAFSLLGLQYAILMGALVGVSVIVPYIGAVVVTIPILILGLMQWGIGSHFLYLMIVYGAIIALDANLLFPWLFAETMDLHPLVIILSVVIFGGLWGFWGVFFAIPLVTLFKAILILLCINMTKTERVPF